MNLKLWSGLIAALLTTAFSTTSSSHAEATKAIEQQTEASSTIGGQRSAVSGNTTDNGQLTADKTTSALASLQATQERVDAVRMGTGYELSSKTEPQENKANLPRLQTNRSGETRSGLTPSPRLEADTIAQVKPHEFAGRQAATLYLRDIPVLTFLSSASASQIAIDPVWRATAVATRINQLNRDKIDANTITVVWNSTRDASITLPSSTTRLNGQQQFQSAIPSSRHTSQARETGVSYIVKVGGENLVEINADTILPDTTNNLAEDALQVTNRLRRLISNAPPLRYIAGIPAPKPVQITLRAIPVVSSVRGLASWYGPGFHGNRSANGEIFNQNALTAAHRTLPFGTQVRVTNLNNGLSVVVRINDRGPYSGRRIIDLSAAAARSLGMMQTGVATVSLEVLGKPQTVALDEN
ncbi:septal ring lytic transglycosylase RlpA family protein [Argonema galeatum]|uniref:septal ring lytic transglycosylase RlpA family protein n=1 Tax=Argonema galeatum TaxID=2942762 RepID=UPI0020137F14|nr:septal ring lytic transglycosylase RlpA family protein [Argonema galeatum]MCL1468849.1 septal ring lytic transglycosylase RlpA family protein [Argonema galeatum A003/A1]